MNNRAVHELLRYAPKVCSPLVGLKTISACKSSRKLTADGLSLLWFLKIIWICITTAPGFLKSVNKIREHTFKRGNNTPSYRITGTKCNAPAPLSCSSAISIARWQRVNKHWAFLGLMAITPLCRLEFHLCRHFQGQSCCRAGLGLTPSKFSQFCSLNDNLFRYLHCLVPLYS